MILGITICEKCRSSVPLKDVSVGSLWGSTEGGRPGAPQVLESDAVRQEIYQAPGPWR